MFCWIRIFQNGVTFVASLHKIRFYFGRFYILLALWRLNISQNGKYFSIYISKTINYWNIWLTYIPFSLLGWKSKAMLYSSCILPKVKIDEIYRQPTCIYIWYILRTYFFFPYEKKCQKFAEFLLNNIFSAAVLSLKKKNNK